MILCAIGESDEYFADVVVVVIDTHLISLNDNAFFNFNFGITLLNTYLIDSGRFCWMS